MCMMHWLHQNFTLCFYWQTAMQQKHPLQYFWRVLQLLRNRPTQHCDSFVMQLSCASSSIKTNCVSLIQFVPCHLLVFPSSTALLFPILSQVRNWSGCVEHGLFWGPTCCTNNCRSCNATKHSCARKATAERVSAHLTSSYCRFQITTHTIPLIIAKRSKIEHCWTWDKAQCTHPHAHHRTWMLQM